MDNVGIQNHTILNLKSVIQEPQRHVAAGADIPVPGWRFSCLRESDSGLQRIFEIEDNST